MRRRIAVLVAATTSLVLAAFLVPLGLLLQQVAADRTVGAATREAETVVPLVATMTDRTALASVLAMMSTDEASRIPLTVFLPDGSVVGVQARRSPAVDLAQRGHSITADAPGGREVLVAAVGLPDGTAVVRTFVSDAQLRAGVDRAWLFLGLLGGGLLILGLVVADRLARSTVRSLRELDGVARRLGDGDLDARARLAGVPDLDAVGVTLNALAGRIMDLLARERESVADLSHRIRTPLTVLRIEAEALSNPAEADRVTLAVDALERAVDQAITDARRGARGGGSTVGVRSGCDAVSVVRDRVAFWQVLAEEEQRSVSTDLPTTLLAVAVAADELAALVDALLGNVFAHTPEGTAFAVRLGPRHDGGAVLSVADAGPGLAPGTGSGTDVLHRGASGAGSTGLGLDIVRRTAEASGGRVGLGPSPSGGLDVTVELGPPVPSSPPAPLARTPTRAGSREAPPPPRPRQDGHRAPDRGRPAPGR
jgi:signal transduction histidine kinase